MPFTSGVLFILFTTGLVRSIHKFSHLDRVKVSDHSYWARTHTRTHLNARTHSNQIILSLYHPFSLAHSNPPPPPHTHTPYSLTCARSRALDTLIYAYMYSLNHSHWFALPPFSWLFIHPLDYFHPLPFKGARLLILSLSFSSLHFLYFLSLAGLCARLYLPSTPEAGCEQAKCIPSTNKFSVDLTRSPMPAAVTTGMPSAGYSRSKKVCSMITTGDSTEVLGLSTNTSGQRMTPALVSREQAVRGMKRRGTP